MITELSEHEPDGGKFEESQSVSGQVFPIFGKAAASSKPSEGSFNDPSFGQKHEAFRMV